MPQGGWLILGVGALGGLVGLGVPILVWLLSPHPLRGRRAINDAAVALIALLVWLSLWAGTLAFERDPYNPASLGYLAGMVAGAVIGRWTAALLPFALLLPSAAFDLLVRAEEYDPTPVTPAAALVFAPFMAVAVAGGVGLSKLLSHRRRPSP
jgi:uncharacterized membrane protein YfcA